MATSSDDHVVGDVLDGRYEIQAVVSHGGTATVYRGVDRRLGRIVAIKLMHKPSDDDVDYVGIFDREARALSALSDPHIVGVFDQGEDRGRPFIVMEYVDGRTLRQVIKHQAPLDPLRAITFMESIAAGLATAHDAGLMHRDIKPENVLISNKGQVKVADFGLARTQTSKTLTLRQGTVMGSVGYLPPERVTGGAVDKHSDVYSAGIVLFELLTGKKPYYGSDDLDTAWMHAHNDVPAPSSMLPDAGIPAFIDQLVLTCTSRNPGDRPEDGRELLRRVRLARRALNAGITDDTDLTQAMNSTVITPAVVVAPGQTAGITGSTTLANTVSAPAENPYTVNPYAANPYADNPYATHDANVDVEHTPQLFVGRDADSVKAKRVNAVRLPAFNNEEKYRKRRAMVGIIAVLVLALIIGFGTWWFVSGRYTDMPDLRNQTREDAVALAERSGITLAFEDAFSEDVPAGLVITTDPAPDTKIRRGGEAKVLVSVGPERYAVPGLIGGTVEEARAALQAMHLELGDVDHAWSETDVGIIIGQSYDEGELVRRNTSVNVTVSQGRQPVDVKDYTGRSAEYAISELGEAGLRFEIIDEFSDDAEPGTVLRQEPNSGTLYVGDIVRLTVSKGPEQIPVPGGLLWASLEDAEARLVAVGLVPEVRYADSSGMNRVTRVSPTSGTMVPQGSTVILHVR